MKKSMTRALSLLLACVFMLGLGLFSNAAANAIPGDIDNDGELTIFDVLFIVKAILNDTPLENSDENGDGKTTLSDVIRAIKLVATGEAPEVGDKENTSADINVENGVVKEAVSINGDKISAAVPEGVVVNKGTTSLTLSVTAMDNTNGNITTEKTEDAISYDVHIEGVAENNTVAIVVDLGAILPIGQNSGTVALYHIENGTPVKMTQVMTIAELDAHNEFYYYPATGNVYVALATFSEIAIVNDTENAWQGNLDYTWYDASKTELAIANADQLAAFGKIVGGMAEGFEADSFAGKTVKLLADINLGDKDNANESLIFYPIGYHYTDDKNEDGTKGDYYSTVSSFEGTFDGNNNTISGFYQNTWEIKGDYDGNYYDDAMGLFGYIVNGRVENLTVDNFSSDGEFTPTGVIAAFAVNSAFENIAITNCNPRVYNTGNGGIIGIAGNSDDTDGMEITLSNITVDNTNKISALWGSWDVACGGLVGMFRGGTTGGKITFTNCHVAAQIDVNNDVCANYQYYWYRYAGMLIGSVRANTTEGGYTVANTQGISAVDCTYTYGAWNEYWYCELVKNSIASYTHDHQFSRLVKIADVSEIFDGENWTREGNFVIPAADKSSAECYHIYKDENGTLYRHFHADAGTETVNGETIPVEDRTCYYIPFGQVLNGHGYGVKPTYEFAGFEEVIDGTVKSDYKFADKGEITEYVPGEAISIGDLFASVVDNSKLSKTSIYVAVSPATEEDEVSADYSLNMSDWTQSTLTFDESSTGRAKVVITDYFYCTPTVIYLELKTEEPEVPVDKFTALDPTFTHTVEGGEINVTLGEVFEAINGATIDSASVEVTVSDGTYTKNDSDWTQSTLVFKGTGFVTVTITDNNLCNTATANVTLVEPEEYDKFGLVFENTDKYLYRVGNTNTVTLGKLFNTVNNATVGEVSVTVTNVAGDATGTYTKNATWTNGTIKFSGTGVVKVTIDDNAYAKALTLCLEVVNATNITGANGSSGTDVVLLNNVKIATDGCVHYINCTVYGNGFTFDVRGGMTEYNSKQGWGVIIINNATLDNLVIVGDIYNTFGVYADNSNNTAAVDSLGGTIQNCHISHCAAPVISRGNTTIKDTTLYGGSVANLLIKSGVNTLENVVTVNNNQIEGRELIGMGVVVHSDADATAKIVLNGNFKQYNFYDENDKPTGSATDLGYKYSLNLYNAMFSSTCSAYHFGSSPDRYVNTGIISMVETATVEDNTNCGYTKTTVNLGDRNGFVYSLPNTVGTVDNNYNSTADAHMASVQGHYPITPVFDLGKQAVNGEDRYLTGDINGVSARYIEGEDPFTLDITKLMSAYKYNGVPCAVTASCEGADANGILTLTTAGNYNLVFKVTDDNVYSVNGEKLAESVEYTYVVPVSLAVAAPEVKDAVINVHTTALTGTYSGISDKTMSFNPLSAITITDAEGTVDLTTDIATTEITYASSSSAFAGSTTIKVTYNSGRVLTMILGKPTLNSPGSSKAITYSNDGTVKSAGGVASKSATGGTWTVTSYSFKGTNGKTVTNNTVVTATFPDKSCVTADTLVTLADGSQKRIDEVTYEDVLLVWDFFNGTYATVPSSIIFYHGHDNFEVLTLNFEDDTVVKVISNHGFFDVGENNFVFIDTENVENFIGHEFVKVNGNGYSTVKLVGYTVGEEYTGCYSIQTAMHNNFIVEEMFSLTIPEYEGWFDYFEIGEGMKYDEEKMLADIEKYGLYTYEDFAEYVTYEQFVAFSGPYLKVLVGRGVLTYDDILKLISTYVNPNA